MKNKEPKLTENQRDWIAGIILAYGVHEAHKILKAANKSRVAQVRLACKDNGRRALPRPINMPIKTLEKIAKEYGLSKNPKGRRRRYGVEEVEKIESLIGKHGVAGTRRYLEKTEGNAPAKVTLRRIANEAGIDVSDHKGGRPPYYDEDQRAWIAGMVVAYGVTGTHRVLKARNSSRLGKARLACVDGRRKVFPKPLTISLVTLAKIAKEYNVNIPKGRGRRTKVA